MDHDERQRADTIDAYWDGLGRRPASGRMTGAGGDLSAIIARLHAIRAERPLFPDPWQSWRDLRRRAPAASPLARGLAIPTETAAPPGHELARDDRSFGPRGPRLPRSRVVNFLATVALILLTLAVGFLALLQGTRTPGVHDIPTPRFFREVDKIPGAVVDRPLFEARFVPGELPDQNVEAFYYRLTMQPGASLDYLVGPACGCPNYAVLAGAGAEAVQSGEYTLRLDAPFRVQHADRPGESDLVLANTEITLGPGDAAIYPHYAAEGEIRNAGSEPVVLVGVAIVELDTAGGPRPSLPLDVMGQSLAYAASSDWSKIPRGPVGVSLRRVTLPAGAKIGPYEPIGLEAMRIDAGRIVRYFYRTGMDEPSLPPSSSVEGHVIPFLSMGPGVRHSLESSENDATELLVATIEPAGHWSGLLAP